MKRPSPQLAAEWATRLRESGFKDLETPSGGWVESEHHRMKVSVLRDYAPYPADESELAARCRAADHPGLTTDQALVARLYASGLPQRRIAEITGCSRKVVASAIAVIRGSMEGTAKKRGRPVDPDSLRSDGMHVGARLTPAAALAMDHCCTVMRIGRSEAVRRGLLALANHVSRK